MQKEQQQHAVEDTYLCIQSLPHHQLLIDQAETSITTIIIFVIISGRSSSSSSKQTSVSAFIATQLEPHRQGSDRFPCWDADPNPWDAEPNPLLFLTRTALGSHWGLPWDQLSIASSRIGAWPPVSGNQSRTGNILLALVSHQWRGSSARSSSDMTALACL